jgi:CheY-like chemotaxis protein
MNDLSNKISRDHYFNQSKEVSNSFDAKDYDEIITKVNLQAIDNCQYRMLRQQGKLHSQRKKKILLVDDEPDTCMVYQIVLEDAGFECISYTDSIKALQEFRRFYYDLILLDIKMPVLNGFELCEKIREIDKTVHIIFITASEVYYEKFRGQHFPELGKINYIKKPIGNDELVRLVNMIIANSISID